MERIPFDERTPLHDTVAGMYNLLFVDSLRPDEIDLYYFESEYVEAEIELPYIGINREEWENEWTPERKIEILLHEFAHVEEGPGELDHGPEFYDRLIELTVIAEAHQSDLEALFGAQIDFEAVHRHIVDSVNEYTVEDDIDSVDGRRSSLRNEFSLPGDAAPTESESRSGVSD